MSKVHKSIEKDNEENSKTHHLTSLMTLLRVFIQHKEGKLVDGNARITQVKVTSTPGVYSSTY